MSSLSEELSQLTTPHPVFEDPEDNENDVTVARLTKKGLEEFAPVASSKLRRKVTNLSTDEDVKYAGKKTSRSQLQEFSFDTDSAEEDDGDRDDEEDGVIDQSDDIEDDEDDEENDDSVDEEEIENLLSFKSKFSKSSQDLSQTGNKFSFIDDGDYSKYADDYDNEDDNEDDEEDDDSDDGQEEDSFDDDDTYRKGKVRSDESEIEEDSEMEEDNDGDGISSFSKSSLQAEIQKGQAAKQQLGLWDALLESRIKFQKAISLINQLPQADTWNEFTKFGQENFKIEASKAQTKLKKLLDKLTQLQTVLLLQQSETSHIVTGSNQEKKKTEDMNEEITSESEEEEEEEKAVTKKDGKMESLKRKLSLEAYPDFIAKRHTSFSLYRNDIIQKWYDKTRLATGRIKSKSFGSFDMSALKQIEQILSDKERLVKRTQIKRSTYRIYGKKEDPTVEKSVSTDPDEVSIAENMKSYDSEIFDDSDFYHQQLRELIERKTSDISDPVALSRQWLEIQKLRNKVKKKVDTKASKGRKTRYNIHKKLVNFIAPKDTCTWSDEARDDLFKSLFGKQFQTSSNDASWR